MSTLTSIYNKLTEIPLPGGAKFIDKDVLEVSYSFADHVQNKKRTIYKNIFLSGDYTQVGPTHDQGDIVASAISPSRKHIAKLREVQSSDSKKRFVEIWSKDSLLICKDVTEAHDSFYTDEHIASLSFNSSEQCVVYSAEANAPKGDDEIDPYVKFRYTPHLGEGLAGKRRPTLYFLHFSLGSKESSITSYAHPDGSTLFGQAIFAASQGDSDILYATGYANLNNDRRLGIKWCLNRPTTIWRLDLSKTTHQVHASQKPTLPGKAYRSPRLFGNQLYWLASDTEGVGHASCSSLYSSDVLVSTSKCLVDVVWDYKHTTNNSLEFPGLFPATVSLPVYPFLSLGTHEGPGKRDCLVLSSTWGSRTTIVLVDLASGQAKDLTPIGGPADTSSSDTPHYISNQTNPVFSWSLLTTDGAERIVCSRSAPGIPPEIVLGTLLPGGIVRWTVIDKPNLDQELRTKLASLESFIIRIPGHEPTETIIVREVSKEKDARYCITIPHGGPHATSTTAFNAAVAAFALQDFIVALPNYTGSLGFGETAARKLLGQCGTLDVSDCISSDVYLDEQGISTPGKHFLWGGSHGGFLTGHLIGRYPDVYSAAVLRNPVISCGEISTSDIADWYFTEFGFPYPTTSPPSSVPPETYKSLYLASPVAHIDGIKARVLLLIGLSDQRVAPTQGINYYHDLKAKGKEVDMLVFPDADHSLDGVEVARISWQSSLE